MALTSKRTLWFSANLETPYAKGGVEDAMRVVTEGNLVNLQSSELENGMHAPTLDIDMECELRPSSTPGHYHLLIDKEMEWSTYQNLLLALVKAGIIERGYYDASMARRGTFLRPAGVVKNQPSTYKTLETMKARARQGLSTEERERLLDDVQRLTKENYALRRDTEVLGATGYARQLKGNEVAF